MLYSWCSFEVTPLCAPALYAYDRLITFDREVDLIWGRPSQRRIPIVPILYVLMHVSTPLYFVINIATWWDLDCKASPPSLWHVLHSAISALRVYAINPRDWSVPIMVFALSLVPVATNLVRTIYQTRVCRSCNMSVSSQCSGFCPLIATRVSTVVGDALVLLATWRVTYGVKRMSHLTKSDIPLTLLLLRDGEHSA
ncbi:uncharacterized protein B0H18DRAFT_872699 [Fomitopsis serialis]|uniref:uncharacterized protein n=1 Tax=Fomitopsis serialis TaxID=139415 RepID=UPI002007E4D6|nr:uncharacterized protein B0H18DRAFT_872699 [Neoantrodia serialis]KAH9931016.1 hypothetical protein B0H18DRAFT_872699 [Neoantrodia serialis]